MTNFVIFVEMRVFYPEKTVRDREKLISFLDSVQQIGPETCVHCPETFGTQNFVGLCNQSGFRSGYSTVNQLIDLVNEINKSFDDSRSYEVRSVFLDISKAFDKV